MTPLAQTWPYLALILVGFPPNEMWRMLGLLVARGVDEKYFVNDPWSEGVAVAVLGGVIAKILLIPPGALAEVPLAVRLGAIACGFCAFLLVRRSVFAGVLAGEAALVVGAFLFVR